MAYDEQYGTLTFDPNKEKKMKQTTTPLDYNFTGPKPGIGATLPNDYDEPPLDYPSTCIYRLPCGICRLLNSQCLKGTEKIEITC